MAEIPTMQKITIRLQKLKYNNKNYAINPNTNILYDYNLAFKEKTLKPVGIVKLNLETFKDGNKRTGTVMFDDKDGRDSMLQKVKSDLDKVNEEARLEQLHREYAPGGPGAKRAEQEFQELVNMLNEAKGGRKNTKRKQKRKRKATRARRGGYWPDCLQELKGPGCTKEDYDKTIENWQNKLQSIKKSEKNLQHIENIKSHIEKVKLQKEYSLNPEKFREILRFHEAQRLLEEEAAHAQKSSHQLLDDAVKIGGRMRLKKGGGRKRSHKRRRTKKSSRKSTRRKSIRKGLKRNIEVKGLEGLAKLATSLVGDV
jgi:hypothetical protein